jgi:type I restriction enzyme S subunit
MKDKKQEQLVPMLRFSEFADNYVKYNFKDIFSFSTGKNIKQGEASPEFAIPCVRYGELYHLYQEVITTVVNRTNLSKSELTFSKGNEILLPSAGEDPLDIGSASALKLSNVAIGRTINILRPISNNMFTTEYVSYYINQKLKKKIATLAKGVSISNVYNSDLKKLSINLPTYEEQKKIASFLTAVDKRIEQLTKKKELLEQYKKGVMQKIFSQEIRFRDEDGGEFGEWETKHLKEIADIRDGTHDSPKYQNHGYPLITSKNLLPDGTIDLDNVNHISNEDYENINKRSKVGIGDILFGMIGTIGNPAIVLSTGFAIKNVALIKSNDHYNKTFLYNFLFSEMIKRQFYRNNAGGTQKFISLGQIRDLHIDLPSHKEQKFIAETFTKVDRQINNSIQELDLNQTYKKGLLQKMFI